MLTMSRFSKYANVCRSIALNGLGIPDRPHFCSYLVTWRCNARCSMCEIWKSRANDREEMGVAEARRAFRNIGRLDVVRISGGEPFMRDDLAEVVGAILETSRPAVVHITTNGMLTDRIVDFMGSVGHPERIHMKVSIDAIGERHSRIRGVPDAYERAIDTLERLSPMKKEKRFVLGVNQTISGRECAADGKELKAVCDRYGIGLYQTLAHDSDVPLYSPGAGTSNRYDSVKKAFTREELTGLLGEMRRDVSIEDLDERLFKKYYLRGLYNRVVKGVERPNPGCVALGSHIRLLPDGDIATCIGRNVIVGNALTDDVGELWRSDRMRKYREAVKSCPGCWIACEVIPNAIYTGDMIRAILE